MVTFFDQLGHLSCEETFDSFFVFRAFSVSVKRYGSLDDSICQRREVIGWVSNLVKPFLDLLDDPEGGDNILYIPLNGVINLHIFIIS